MSTVNQPSQNPTNKLTAAVAAAAFMEIAGLAVRNLAPEWYDPAAWGAMTPVIILVFGYYIKDRPNV
jgi:hypothetical protein